MTWQPIETAPKEGPHIDLWFKFWRPDTDDFAGGRVTDCYWLRDSKRWASAAMTMPHNVKFTHWMPIPEAPL